MLKQSKGETEIKYTGYLKSLIKIKETESLYLKKTNSGVLHRVENQLNEFIGNLELDEKTKKMISSYNQKSEIKLSYTLEEEHEVYNLYKINFTIKKEDITMSTETNKNQEIIIAGRVLDFKARSNFIKILKDYPEGYYEVEIVKNYESNVVLVYYNQEPIGFIKDNEFITEKKMKAVVNTEKTGLKIYANLIESTTVKKKDTIEQEINRISEFMPKEDIEARIDYMKENKISSRIINKILEKIKPVAEGFEAQVPKGDNLFINNDNLLDDALVNILINAPQLLVGPKSVGKNVLTMTIAWLLNKPIAELALNAQIQNSELLGTTTLRAREDGSSESYFKLSNIMECIKVGGVVVFDELNVAPTYFFPILNGALDTRKRISIQEYGVIPVSEDTIIFGTMNPNYGGTFELNEAFMDRFSVLTFENKVNLLNIIENQFEKDDIDLALASKLQQLYVQFVNMSNEDSNLNSILSVRGFMKVYESVYFYEQSILRALKNNIISKIQDEESEEIVLDTIKYLI